MNNIESFKGDSKIKFLFIGRDLCTDYSAKCLKKISENTNCEYIGEKSRDEIWKIYQAIDGVIVPSEEETLSLVAVEAMMMGKVCIVSDNCGVADYIEYGENGFVYKLGDYTELLKILDWVKNNKEQIEGIEVRARKTYEKNFTTKLFKKRLDRILDGRKKPGSFN